MNSICVIGEKMSKLLIMPMTYCRSNGYFVVGLIVGIFMSLLFFQLEIDEHNFHEPMRSSWYSYTFSTIDQSVADEYAPKINIEGKPRRPQKSPKSFVRPRYYFTELGIREKLFMGVLTSQEYLHSRGAVFNRTVGHLVEKIRYFISIPEGAKKPNISLSGIVGFTDTRSVLKPFHVVKYITDNFLEDYDYYYIVKDKSYINGRKLMNFIEGLGVSNDVYLGIPSEYNSSYCSLDAGILLSNSLVRKLKTNLDWCVKNTYSTSDDINFGSCIDYATKISCTMKIDEKIFRAKRLPLNFNFTEHLTKSTENRQQLDNELIESISIFPFLDHMMIYRLNTYFLIDELKKVEKTIRQLREKILSSAHLGPNNRNKNTVPWPVGNWPGNKAPGRFDVLRWNYFNETHVFMQTDFENLREIIGITKLDIDRVLQAAINKMKIDYKDTLKFNKLVNGYYKFDASRGMDYILDLSLVHSNEQLEQSGNKKILKRVQITKPLDKVEILPVPYVTENTRINMVLIVYSSSIDEILDFMEHYAGVCMEKRDKTSLMLVLIYNRESPSKGLNDVYRSIKSYAMNLTDKYRSSQSKISWLSIRLPNLSSNRIKSDSLFRIVAADLVVQKFPSDSLLLFIQTKIILTPEFLNRIRMNTISQWQIFCPIPFVAFHPDLAYADESKNVEIDINHNHGRYDELNYESISFYKKDYQTMRRTCENDIPIIHSDRDIANKIATMTTQNIVDSLYELFIAHSNVHVFRAIEPALKIYYSEINCNDKTNENAREQCIISKSRRFGHRGQLARLITEYQEK